MNLRMRKAAPEDAETVVALVGELLEEIMQRTAGRHFDLDRALTLALCRAWLTDGSMTALLCHDGDGRAQAVATLVESAALYAQGLFGILQEFYVRPQDRGNGLGAAFLAEIAALAEERGWRCLELCTPPLPEFERALAFYERQGFSIAGGRKMRRKIGAGG